MRQREGGARLGLASHRLVHPWITMSQYNSRQPHRIVDVLVVVRVPNVAALPPDEVPGRHPLHELRGSLAERLGTSWNESRGSAGELVRTFEDPRVFGEGRFVRQRNVVALVRHRLPCA